MISNIFFAMIASIVLVNLLYFVLILYEQWQEYKKDQARQKDVAEHGVLPIMKLIYLKQKQVVASQRKPKQWPSIETDQEKIRKLFTLVLLASATFFSSAISFLLFFCATSRVPQETTFKLVME